MKVAGSRDSFEQAASLIVEALGDGARLAEAVTWVPAGPSVYQRGFDQGQELALALARRLGIPCRPMLARRNRVDQRALTREARFAAAADAFAPKVRAVAGIPSVLLVDDVTTTGASLYHASLALREAGARRVIAAALARTPRHHP